ncbi:hypothetical protein J2Z32_001928 [Paenibacillus turicensis]|uniref:Uncharacterized protein n=1 Tax=Paenibacillus turicensis TaxID=160487 RepID=A0ABS4FRV5_9BACL|nr:hypothetical protein [Paenibacillus turicensis]MBP1905300.1 hypothetical protein [Paenibacillus turicensis]
MNQLKFNTIKKDRYEEYLVELFNKMIIRLEECEPELVVEYVKTILDLLDRLYALNRKLEI